MTTLKPEVLSGMKNVFDEISPRMKGIFVPWLLKHPRYLRNALNLIKSYKKSELLREKALEEGLVVPPVLIFSITSRCNLSCKGCFAYTVGNIEESIQKESITLMKKDEWTNIITQANNLGVYTYLIAGGEPFLFPDLIDLCAGFKKNLFVIFTNGTALVPSDLDKLKKSPNIVIIVSIEGGKELTDSRRGNGVFDSAMKAIEILNRYGTLSGISVTITRTNYKYWMEERNLDFFIRKGIKLGFFIEYIPTGQETENGQNIARSPLGDLLMDSSESCESMVLDDIKRKNFRNRILFYKSKKPMFIIHSPGDEEIHGGCVSAGRGFAHITPFGDLTPCPVSNIATHNLKTSSLKEGLASRLFAEIRESEHLLENKDGPCALFSHQKELEELKKKVGGYKTGY